MLVHMKIMPLTVLLILGLGGPSLSSTARAQARVEVQRAVDAVTEAGATQVVEDLVAFGTRFTGTLGGEEAVLRLLDELRALGYEASLESFTWNSQTMQNVSARKVGLVRPNEVWIAVAHHDSTSDDRLVFAPGADDNASGVAAVIEMARALAPLRHEATIEFLLTAGEEQGLRGAQHDAQEAIASGETIAGVINHDMIGYWPTGWSRDLDVNGNAQSYFIAQAYEAAAIEHVPDVPVDARADWGVCGDDQAAYAALGIPAVVVMDCREAHLGQDGESTPHYHRTSDTIATLDLPRMTEVIRASTAAIATLAVPIERALLLDQTLSADESAGTVLRVGDPLGGGLTRLDPELTGTEVVWNPTSPTLLSGAGEAEGSSTPGAFSFFETDRDETLRVSRSDADADGRQDILLLFGP